MAWCEPCRTEGVEREAHDAEDGVALAAILDGVVDDGVRQELPYPAAERGGQLEGHRQLLLVLRPIREKFGWRDRLQQQAIQVIRQQVVDDEMRERLARQRRLCHP